MSKKHHAKGAKRKDDMLTEACRLAANKGYKSVTPTTLADAMGCAHSAISYYFNTIPQLQRDVMRHAIRTENLTVIAQGLADGNSHARKAPVELRRRAVEAVL